MPPAERQVLMAPDAVARAVAAVAPDRNAAWMLRQPRPLRQSFAEEVLGAPDRELAEQIWMLRQSDEVCASYIDEVLLGE